MPGPAFPSWAYNATQPAQIVASQAALTALGSGWQTTPFPPTPPVSVPFDLNLPTTDTRLQQILIEARVGNLLLAQGLNIADDPAGVMRAEVLANDSGLAT